MKWLLFFFAINCNLLIAAQRPLHVVVKDLQKKWDCTVSYPAEIENRRTEQKSWRTLRSALRTIFHRENFSLVRQGGKVVVEVLDKSADSPLGQVSGRQARPVKVSTGKSSAEVDGSSLLVGFQSNMSQSEKIAKLNQYGLKYDKRAMDRKFFLVGVGKADVQQLRKELKQDPKMKVSYNYIVREAAGQNIGIRIGGSTGVQTGGESGVGLGGGDQSAFNDPSWAYRVLKANAKRKNKVVYEPKLVVLDTGLTKSHKALVGRNISSHNLSGEVSKDNDSNGHGTGVMGVLASDRKDGIRDADKVNHVSLKVFED